MPVCIHEYIVNVCIVLLYKKCFQSKLLQRCHLLLLFSVNHAVGLSEPDPQIAGYLGRQDDHKFQTSFKVTAHLLTTGTL